MKTNAQRTPLASALTAHCSALHQQNAVLAAVSSPGALYQVINTRTNAVCDEFETERAAFNRAEELARMNPGKKYSVCVNGLLVKFFLVRR